MTTQADTTSITFSMPPPDITAMVQHMNDVWVGTSKGQIIQTQTDAALNHMQCWPDPETNQPELPIEPGSVVDGIYTCPSVNLLLAHISKPGVNGGRVVTVKKEAPYLTDLSKNSKFLAVSSQEKCDFPFAYSEGSKIHLYKAENGNLSSNSSVYDVDAEIQALSINSAGIAYYAGSKYMLMLFKFLGKPVIVTTSFVQKPLVVPFDDLSFVYCLPGTLIVKSETQTSPPIFYNKGLQNIPNERPNIMITYQEKLFQFFPTCMASARISFKHQEPFQSKPIGRVRIVARYDKALFLVTDTEVRQFGGQTKGTECALKAESQGLETALIMFRALPPETQPNELIDMFKTLWKDGQLKLALETLTKVMWPHDIREVISLFSPIMVELPTKLEARVLLTGAKTITEEQLRNKEVKEAFGDFLEATARMYKDSGVPSLTSQMTVIDSCLFQFYALNHLTRRLDKFLSQPNSMDGKLVARFLNEKVKKLHLLPAFAIYQARMGPQENNIGLITALKVWEKLNEADPSSVRWAEEASYTLRDIKTDTEGQSRKQNEELKMHHLKWMLARSPMAAVNTFMYPNVVSQEGNFIEAWLNSIPVEKDDVSLREGLRLVYLNYATSSEAVKPPRSIIGKALTAFCNLLMLLEVLTQVIKAPRLLFCQFAPGTELNGDNIEKATQIVSDKIAALLKMVVFKDEVEPELVDKVETTERSDMLKYIEILEGKVKLTENPTEPLPHPQTQNRRVLFLFYQAAIQYKSAANIMIDSHGKFDQTEVQNFCRNCPCPETAFWICLQKIVNPSLFTQNPTAVKFDEHRLKGPFRDLMLENIEWIDAAKMVKFEPETDGFYEDGTAMECADFMIDLIPDDGDIDTYYPILRLADAILQQKEKLARIKLGVVRNLELDASYRLVLAQKRNIEVQYNTLCKTCQRPVGNGWLSISPQNEVYHIACVKNDDKNVPDPVYL